MSFEVRPTPEVDLTSEVAVPAAPRAPGAPASDKSDGRLHIRRSLDVDLAEEVQAQKAERERAVTTVRPPSPWRLKWRRRVAIIALLQAAIVAVMVFVLWQHNVQMAKVMRLATRQAQAGAVTTEMDGLRTALACELVATDRLRAGSEFEAFARGTIKDPRHLRDTARDVYGRSYQYSILTDSSDKTVGFRLVSAGPDGVFGTADDIVMTYDLRP